MNQPINGTQASIQQPAQVVEAPPQPKPMPQVSVLKAVVSVDSKVSEAWGEDMTRRYVAGKLAEQLAAQLANGIPWQHFPISESNPANMYQMQIVVATVEQHNAFMQKVAEDAKASAQKAREESEDARAEAERDVASAAKVRSMKGRRAAEAK